MSHFAQGALGRALLAGRALGEGAIEHGLGALAWRAGLGEQIAVAELAARPGGEAARPARALLDVVEQLLRGAIGASALLALKDL